LFDSRGRVVVRHRRGCQLQEPALRATAVRVVHELDLSDLTLAGGSMGARLAQQ
jgi:hypothetical protein